jgi:hypothetical protein
MLWTIFGLLLGCNKEHPCTGCLEVCLEVATESKRRYECLPIAEECPELENHCTLGSDEIEVNESCVASFEEACGNRYFDSVIYCAEVCEGEECISIPYAGCYF